MNLSPSTLRSLKRTGGEQLRKLQNRSHSRDIVHVQGVCGIDGPLHLRVVQEGCRIASWAVTNTAADVAYSEAPSGAFVARLLNPKSSTYLIGEDGSGSFARMTSGGLEVEPGQVYEFGASVAVEGGARARIIILEYDETGNRFGTQRYSAEQSVCYVAPLGVRRILLTLRFEGPGSVAVQEIVCKLRRKARATSQGHARSNGADVGHASVPLVGGDTTVSLPVKASWISANDTWRMPDTDQVSFRNLADGTLRVESHDASNAQYLVLNGTTSDFRQISAGHGIAVRPGSGFLLKVDLARIQGLNLKIVVVEFDDKGKRLGFNDYLPNSAVIHGVNAKAARTLLALRVKGKGVVDLSVFECEFFSRVAAPTKIAPETSSAVGTGVATIANMLLQVGARRIPESNGSRHHSKAPYSVGVISDVYMFNFYKDAFSSVHYVSPSNYGELLNDHDIDMLIYTTCWSGINKDEWRGAAYRESVQSALDDILKYCKDKKVPTVFQSIEDPSNYEYFLPIARKFDVVLTTDTDCLDRYMDDLGHGRVYFCEYGVNPHVNNPIGCRREAVNAAFFAGSFPTKYPERCQDMEILFDSVNRGGERLLIADRNFGSGNPSLDYPARFRSMMMGPLDHLSLQAAHKYFRWAVNFNSIKSSPSMCAMRVYELQAQGRRMLSNYARSVLNRFPDVQIVPEPCDGSWYFRDETLEDYRAAMRSVRNVMTRNTAYDVAIYVAGLAGLKGAKLPKKRVGVFGPPSVRTAIKQQDYADVVYLGSDLPVDDKDWASIRNKRRISYFTWMSEEYEYDRFYLTDLVNGFKYVDVDFITKAAYFDRDGLQAGPQHEYTNEMRDRARTLFDARVLSPIDLTDSKAGEGRGYAIDPFELNTRHYLSSIRSSGPKMPLLSVIVPVHNNGRFLRSKCMESLRRNESWPNFEILLIDDASNDVDTISICEELRDAYGNVRLISLGQEPSGSASAPRNRGVEEACADLVTYLDPDNEISPGGYDKLLAIYADLAKSGQPVDFVSGYQVKVAQRNSVTGRHTRESVLLCDDLRLRFFEAGKFPVVSTQAAVIRRSFLIDSGIKFVERALGQDTLYGWEMLAHAKRGAFTSDAHLIYYGERADSVTNSVGTSFFRKSLALETAQVMRLAELSLLDLFMEHHFDRFFNDWYLRRLATVVGDARQESEQILGQIAALYGREWSPS